MKKLEKMSLLNIEGRLTRTEMKNIMAGSGYSCCTATSCSSCRQLEQGIPYCNVGTITPC